jgi:hypothetical protein
MTLHHRAYTVTWSVASVIDEMTCASERSNKPIDRG